MIINFLVDNDSPATLKTNYKRVINQAIAILRGVNLEITPRISKRHLTSPIVYPPELGPFQVPGFVRDKFIKEFSPTGIWHLCLGPVILGRYEMFGGAAGCVCCKDVKVSCSTVFMCNHLVPHGVAAQIDSAAKVMAHEIAHLFGAQHHDNTPNIMHSYMNVYSSHKGLKWHPKTLGEIRQCLKQNSN